MSREHSPGAGSHNLPSKLRSAHFPQPEATPRDLLFIPLPAGGHGFSYGTVKPADGRPGYLPGAEFLLLDGSDGTAARFINLGTAAACDFQLDATSALGSRVVIVGAGCRYGTIAQGRAAAAALTPTAASPVVILVMPGMYPEKVPLRTSYASLVGLDRQSCLIDAQYFEPGTGGYNTGDPIVDVDNAVGVTVANLRIRNTYPVTEENGGFAPAFGVTGASVVRVENCYIGGNGGRDVASVHNSAVVEFTDSTIEQYNPATSSSHMLWVRNQSKTLFKNCLISTLGTGNGPQLNDQCDATFDGCRFHFANPANHVFQDVLATTLRVVHCSIDGPTLFPPPGFVVTNLTLSHNVGFGGLEIRGTERISASGHFTGGDVSGEVVSANVMLKLPPSDTVPAGVEGDMYHNTVDHKAYIHNGTAWQPLW